MPNNCHFNGYLIGSKEDIKAFQGAMEVEYSYYLKKRILIKFRNI